MSEKLYLGFYAIVLGNAANSLSIHVGYKELKQNKHEYQNYTYDLTPESFASKIKMHQYDFITGRKQKPPHTRVDVALYMISRIWTFEYYFFSFGEINYHCVIICPFSIWSNSSSMQTSVFSGTIRLVSWANLNSWLILEIR